MKTNYTDEQIQAAIDAACEQTQNVHNVWSGLLYINKHDRCFAEDADTRRDLLKCALARLPEPTPPVVDGKTPGQVNHDAVANGDYETYKKWSEISERGKCDIERGSSAVLAAFGQPSLEAAIARMEAVDVWDVYKHHPSLSSEEALGGVKARLIAAARDGSQPADVDPYAELKKAHAEGKVIQVFVKDDEWGPDRWSEKQNNDYSLPVERYRIKPEPSPASAPAWQPAVGDTVRLKSGGPVMTIGKVSDEIDVFCFRGDDLMKTSIPLVCLTPAKEAQP
jgi:hypothetical protein